MDESRGADVAALVEDSSRCRNNTIVGSVHGDVICRIVGVLFVFDLVLHRPEARPLSTF